MNRLSWVISVIVILSACQSTAERQELAGDYYNIANAYTDLEDFEKASFYYERALELDPSLNQAVFNKAKVDLEIGNYDQALKQLTELHEKDPENVMILEVLGYTWYKKGEESKALEYYEQCLSLDPVHSRTLYNLCLLEKNRENWQESRSYLARLLEIENIDEYLLLAAEIERAVGNIEEAVIYYEDFLLENEGNPEVYTALKEIYVDLELYDDATKMLDNLILSAEKDDSGELYFEKCSIELLIMEDVVKGQQDLQNALDAGFFDQERFDELLEGIEPIFRDEIRVLIETAAQQREINTVDADDPETEELQDPAS